jgi:uncharacterized protein YwgA
MVEYNLHLKVMAIIQNAGGELVGRTRLQKVAYLSQLAGFSSDFSFEYRHYGPFSKELAEAMDIATGLQLVQEDERQAQWGARYSVYSIDLKVQNDDDRTRFVSAAAAINSIALELAATAAFLSLEDENRDPWEETCLRKPEKASNGNLAKAKEAYRTLMGLGTPEALPNIL